MASDALAGDKRFVCSFLSSFRDVRSERLLRRLLLNPKRQFSVSIGMVENPRLQEKQGWQCGCARHSRAHEEYPEGSLSIKLSASSAPSLLAPLLADNASPIPCLTRWMK